MMKSYTTTLKTDLTIHTQNVDQFRKNSRLS